MPRTGAGNAFVVKRAICGVCCYIYERIKGFYYFPARCRCLDLHTGGSGTAMSTADSSCSIWAHMVGALADDPQRAVEMTAISTRRSGAANDPISAATIKVLGRASPITISVSWRDPTACRYDDQVWRAGVARHAGFCALTRSPIRAGDCIYRPIPIRPRPVNSNFMILAAVVMALEVCDA